MTPKPRFCSVWLFLCLAAAPAQAALPPQDPESGGDAFVDFPGYTGSRGFYVGAGGGLVASVGPEMHVSGANNPTRCDRLLYANPADAPTDAECTNLDNPLAGQFTFGRGSGVAGHLALGYGFGGITVEIEGTRQQFALPTGDYSTTAASGSAITDKDTEWSAILPPRASVTEFSGSQLLLNLYFEWGNRTRLTPYIGIGAGMTSYQFTFGGQFVRKSIAEGYLEVFGGSASEVDDAPEWQRAAAGTVSSFDGEVSHGGLGLQALAGAVYDLNPRAGFVVRIRWVLPPSVSVEETWTSIRGHAPVRADGAPFDTRFDFSDLGFLGLSASLKYGF